MEHSPLPIIDLAALNGAPEVRRPMLARLAAMWAFSIWSATA